MTSVSCFHFQCLYFLIISSYIYFFIDLTILLLNTVVMISVESSIMVCKVLVLLWCCQKGLFQIQLSTWQWECTHFFTYRFYYCNLYLSGGDISNSNHIFNSWRLKTFLLNNSTTLFSYCGAPFPVHVHTDAFQSFILDSSFPPSACFSQINIFL